MTLGETYVGQTVKVVALTIHGPTRRRIMDMGITKGTTVRLKRVAPLGDPMELEVRGYSLSLRKADANLILVEQ